MTGTIWFFTLGLLLAGWTVDLFLSATIHRTRRRTSAALRTPRPKCKVPMRIIVPIEAPGVVRTIRAHLGLWRPLEQGRGPPPSDRAWPVDANLPLTYHPVPDIA